MYRIVTGEDNLRSPQISFHGDVTEEQIMTLLEAVKSIWPNAKVRRTKPLEWEDVSSTPAQPLYDSDGLRITT